MKIIDRVYSDIYDRDKMRDIYNRFDMREYILTNIGPEEREKMYSSILNICVNALRDPSAVRSVFYHILSSNSLIRIHRINEHTAHILSINTYILPFDKITASYILKCSEGASDIVRFRLTKSFVINSNFHSVEGRDRSVFTCIDRLEYIGISMGILSSPGIDKHEYNEGIDIDTEYKALNDAKSKLEYQHICTTILKRYVYYKMVCMDRSIINREYSTVDAFMMCSHKEMVDLLSKYREMLPDTDTNTFVTTYNTILTSIVSHDYIVDTVISVYHTHDIQDIHSILFETEADCTRLVLETVARLTDREYIERVFNKAYLFDIHTYTYPISIILYMDNLLSHTKSKYREYRWESIVYSIEYRCEYYNMHHLDNRVDYTEKVYDMMDLKYDYVWLYGMLMKHRCMDTASMYTIYLDMCEQVHRDDTIYEGNVLYKMHFIMRIINIIVNILYVMHRDRVDIDTRILHTRVSSCVSYIDNRVIMLNDTILYDVMKKRLRSVYSTMNVNYTI